jgi:tetratricopeptide (TPR) repeat protein
MGFWGALLIFIYGWIFDEEEGLRHLRQLLLPLRRAGRRWELAFALQNLGRLIYTQLPDEAPDPHLAEALQHLTEALALFQELRDELESGYTLRLLGVVRMMQRHFPEARDHLLAAQAKLEACGDQANAASINWLLADIHLRLGEYEMAFGYLRRMRQAYADRSLQSDALSRESYEALRYSTIDHAKQTREQTLALVREAGDDFSLAWSAWEMGEIYRVAGEVVTARQWYEQARVLFEKAQDKSGNIFYHRGLGDIAHALGDYGEAQRQFQASLNATQQMKHEWGAAYALAGLGRASLALGEHELAHRHFLEALRKAYKIGDGGILMLVMTGIAGLYAAHGQEERAVELCTLVDHEPMSWRETKEQAAAALAAATAALPPERLSAARERSHGSDIWKTAERVRQEMSGSTLLAR